MGWSEWIPCAFFDPQDYARYEGIMSLVETYIARTSKEVVFNRKKIASSKREEYDQSRNAYQ